MDSEKVLIIGAGHIGAMMSLHYASKRQRVFLWDENPALRKKWKNRELPFHDQEMENVAKIIKSKKRWPIMLNSLKESGLVRTVIVCVGTPATEKGYDLSAVKKAVIKAAELLAGSGGNIVVRSTLPPRTCSDVLIPLIRAISTQVRLIYFPEFSREGTSLQDFWRTRHHAVAHDSAISKIEVAKITGVPVGKVAITSFETAEMLKVSSNMFHALKVCFANEIGRAATANGANTDMLMKIFLADTKLNTSAAYLRPGFSFGGPCLKKDLAGSLATFKKSGVKTPVLSSVMSSNEGHLDFIYKSVIKLCPANSRIGILGTSFKPFTKDNRNSQVTELVQRLQKNFRVQAFESGSDVKLESFLAGQSVILLGAMSLSADAVEFLKSRGCILIDLRLNFDHFKKFKGYTNYYRVV